MPYPDAVVRYVLDQRDADDVKLVVEENHDILAALLLDAVLEFAEDS